MDVQPKLVARIFVAILAPFIFQTACIAAARFLLWPRGGAALTIGWALIPVGLIVSIMAGYRRLRREVPHDPLLNVTLVYFALVLPLLLGWSAFLIFKWIGWQDSL